jgi:hypothetical protein
MVRMMLSLKFLMAFFLIGVAVLSFAKGVSGQTQTDAVKTFLDFSVVGIRAQVNATAEALPTENVTVNLVLTGQTEVYVNYFNLSIFGFLNGTQKMLMANVTDSNFSLNNTSRAFSFNFTVPEQVWDVTYGELVLAHSATYGPVTVNNDGLMCGFSMTSIKNVYLESLEKQLGDLKQMYQDLNSTYWELEQNFTKLEATINELDNTRRLAVILGITTVVFVVTTLYVIMRKPREPW